MASLVLIIALAWLYLWREAVSMGEMGMAMPGMTMPGTPRSVGIDAFALAFAMWTVMMVGMMLPSASPTILLYGALVRKNGERGTILPGVWIFTGGYLVVWTAFSLVATTLQVALEKLSLVTPMMVSANKTMSAAILIAAGIYQWLPFKNVCLSNCRNPMQFLVARWRSGAGGAFRMGVENGAYCVGCCWAIMLLLFVAGVMNLMWVALITAFVFVEKLQPQKYISVIAGVVLVLTGGALLMKP